MSCFKSLVLKQVLGDVGKLCCGVGFGRVGSSTDIISRFCLNPVSPAPDPFGNTAFSCLIGLDAESWGALVCSIGLPS